MTEFIIPTEIEHEEAIAKAWHMRNEDHDPDHIAKTLLSHDHRLKKLQAVMDAAGYYLHSGLAGKEHHILEMAIAEVKKSDSMSGAQLSLEDEIQI